MKTKIGNINNPPPKHLQQRTQRMPIIKPKGNFLPITHPKLNQSSHMTPKAQNFPPTPRAISRALHLSHIPSPKQSRPNPRNPNRRSQIATNSPQMLNYGSFIPNFNTLNAQSTLFLW
ncbi:hypothetical protein ACOSP7_031262 [Xanthoceras sorbifolium]